MWRFGRCVVVSLEVLLGLGLSGAWGQSLACAPLAPYQAPAGTPELTAQQELWLSQAMEAESEGALDGVADPALQAELQKVMARLTAVLPPLGFPVELHLVLADEANAFDMAGGQIFVTRPLISRGRGRGPGLWGGADAVEGCLPAMAGGATGTDAHHPLVAAA